MRSVNKELSLEERAEAERFFERIGEKDTANVKRLVTLVDSHTDDYFSSGELEKVHYCFNDGEAFFTVYGIGGNVTKDGVRPDLDLMIVTNMRYSEGFSDYYDNKMDDPYSERSVEPLWRRINLEFRVDMTIKRHGEIPDNYNLGLTKGKCIITLTPKNGAKKIDVVYIKSMAHHEDPSTFFGERESKESLQDDYSQCSFNSEADFNAKDLRIDGQPSAKILLYRANTSDIEKPQLRWRYCSQN